MTVALENAAHGPAGAAGPSASTKTDRKEVPILAQVASQRAWNYPRLGRLLWEGKQTFDFTTAGTSGRNPKELLETIRQAPFLTAVVVDVRATPYSRYRSTWNTGNVKRGCEGVGIAYEHLPILGVPAEQRGHLHTGEMTYAQFFQWYDSTVLTEANLSRVRELLPQRPLLLCTELGPTYCHRHRIALVLEKEGLVGFDL